MTKETELKTYGQVRGVLRKDCPWLAAEDLDGDLELTIDKVMHHPNAEMQDGIRSVVAVHFEDHPKAWVLNMTNGDQLAEMFGRDVAGWHGKKVTIHAAKLDRPAFGRKYGLRLK